MPNPTAHTIQHTGCIVGEAARLDEQDQQRFEAHAAEHYRGLAREARLEGLLREARNAIGISRPSDVDLVQRIDRFFGDLGGLVLERLPSGEFAWLHADLTVKP
jgi:hypothetical protein